jgi:hypothetical protein
MSQSICSLAIVPGMAEEPPARLGDARAPREPGMLEESLDGVDLTLIRWTLSLTPLERLEVLQDWVDGLTELRRGRVPEH